MEYITPQERDTGFVAYWQVGGKVTGHMFSGPESGISQDELS